MNIAHITTMEIAEKKLYHFLEKLSAVSEVGNGNGHRIVTIIRRLARMMAQIEVDNILTLDWWWDEHEDRMKRERQAYEEAEREDKEN